MIRFCPMAEEHALSIMKMNEGCGVSQPVSKDMMIRSWMSPGSRALTMMIDETPAACGGIINLMWHRGEAWVLTSILCRGHEKSLVSALVNQLPKLAWDGEFIRVQATSFDRAREKFFRLLGFTLETPDGMQWHGPNGETAFLYSRIFL